MKTCGGFVSTAKLIGILLKVMQPHFFFVLCDHFVLPDHNPFQLVVVGFKTNQ
jgi:hypothetical protein